MTRRYVALARVSSREQQREGFSLDVQEEALRRYAARQDGQIIKLLKIAETATRPQERKVFRELLAYARRHANSLDGVLVYKIDRAARHAGAAHRPNDVGSRAGPPGGEGLPLLRVDLR